MNAYPPTTYRGNLKHIQDGNRATLQAEPGTGIVTGVVEQV